jgi:hypothetical protein
MHIKQLGLQKSVEKRIPAFTIKFLLDSLEDFLVKLLLINFTFKFYFDLIYFCFIREECKNIVMHVVVDLADHLFA